MSPSELTGEQPRAYMLPSQTHDWATPKGLMDQIWVEFKPDLDPCGAREHHYSAWLIEHYGGRFMDGSTPAMDGLTQPWHCRCAYMNPPYGDPLRKFWVPKAVREVECGNAGMVVALLPARTDTRWWQRYVIHQVESQWELSNNKLARIAKECHPNLLLCRFLPGRLKFGESKNSAPFPSAIVVWGSNAAATKAGREGA